MEEKDHNNKSKEGAVVVEVEPPPTPTDQWVQQALPPEVWKMVLDSLKGDPVSLVHCTKTCTTWSDLIKKSKPTFLFSMVFPSLEKYLFRNDKLNCRQVCKTWKAGVDPVLQKHTDKWSPHFDDNWLVQLRNAAARPTAPRPNNHHHHEDYSWNGFNTFYSSNQIDRFLKKMSNNQSPFPTKAVLFQTLVQTPIVAPPQGQPLALVGQRTMAMHMWLHDFIKKFGSHVLNFNYVARDLLINEVPGFVVNLLKSMPHLQRLTIVQEGIVGVPDFYNSGALQLALPKLPDLTELVVTGHHVRRLLNSLLEAYGPQLEELEVADEFLTLGERSMGPSPEGSINLQRLQRLKLTSRPGDHDSVRRLYCLAKLNLPSLQRLAIDFPKKPNDKIPLRSLVAVLNRFSSSLVEVHLPIAELRQLQIRPSCWNITDAVEMHREMELLLPSVNVLGLCISLTVSPVFIRLLKKFPALKRLELYEFGVQPQDLSDGIQGLSMKGVKLMRTQLFAPLWRIVPTLRVIVVWRRREVGKMRQFYWLKGERMRYYKYVNNS